MSKKTPITAEAFKNKATRIIEIPGHDGDETIPIRIRPTSLVGMMTNGKLPNELLVVVMELFNKMESKSESVIAEEIMKNDKMLADLNDMMRAVCNEVMLEPKFEEVEEYMTDEQIQSVFNQAQGSVRSITPSV